MKIKVIKKPYNEVAVLPKPEHKNPKKSNYFLRYLMKELGKGDLKDTSFKVNYLNIDKIPDYPCLVLMNHSAFIDLEIVGNLFFPKPFAIVCTSDGFVGKEGLMRNLGCIPTNKFVTDTTLISDISYALKKNKTSVLMYPEASYSFDGTATPLPQHFGTFIKLLKTPVLMIRTHGAFVRDPLYNMLQKRKTNVSADVKLLLSTDEIKSKKASEIDEILENEFSFDNFAEQQNNNTAIVEGTRADGLHRILYKCPKCEREGTLIGKYTDITCSCGFNSELDIFGRLTGEYYNSVPDWYKWERNEVKKEIEDGTYRLEFDCNILVFRDFKAVYDVGRGHLVHDKNGFELTGENGLHFHRSPNASYSLYADYFWYEIGDVICIGDNEMQFYCFPDEKDAIPVAKARLAAEEMYKINKNIK